MTCPGDQLFIGETETELGFAWEVEAFEAGGDEIKSTRWARDAIGACHFENVATRLERGTYPCLSCTKAVSMSRILASVSTINISYSTKLSKTAPARVVIYCDGDSSFDSESRLLPFPLTSAARLDRV